MMLKIIILLGIAACVAPFFIDGPDGQPLMSLDDWQPEMPSVELPGASDEVEITTVYKWQDEDGVWQFSNNPVDAQGAEQMALDGKINTMPAPQMPTSRTEKKSAPVSIPGVATVSPGQAAELLDTVNNLQDTIDQRKADLDALKP
jgi:hypothetical protein